MARYFVTNKDGIIEEVCADKVEPCDGALWFWKDFRMVVVYAAGAWQILTQSEDE